MNYRRVPKTNWNVSTLTYGCMRFRDEETAVAAIHKAIEVGVNYFDVAPLYGGGTAEVYVGKGLKGLRHKAIVTAKSSPGNGGDGLCDCNPGAGFGIRTADEARREIERSMKILGVDHLDMYQFWALHSDVVFKEGLKRGGFMEGVLKAKEEGLFDFIGMTTHSESDDIIRYIKESPYEFDMVTMPFSLINPGRMKAVQYCAERGIGVQAMNPLAGGHLARTVPVFKKLAATVECDSMVEASLRYIVGLPGAVGALCGMTLAGHVVDGAKAVAKGALPPGGEGTLRASLDELSRAVAGHKLCTACGYCGECPEGIIIPEVLALYTDLRVPGLAQEARKTLLEKLAANPVGLDPAACVKCGQCEAKCPNKIPVSELMAAAASVWK
jgi:predicted aldo/keto reductase-like oxidoreductase